MSVALTERFTQAIDFARVRYADLEHLDRRSPYLAHALAIASIVLEFGGTENEAIAALVRDSAVAGDRSKALSEIRSSFGEEVAALVEATINPVLLSGADSGPWKRRMAPTIDRLKHEKNAAAFRISVAEQAHIAEIMVATREDYSDEILASFAPTFDDAWWYHEAMQRAIEHSGECFDRGCDRDPTIFEIVSRYDADAELLLEMPEEP